MLGKVNYNDLNKFLVSLGLALIISAFALPWSVLIASKNIIISQEDYGKLLPKSSLLVQAQHNASLFFLKNIYSITFFLLFIGIVLILIGLVKWQKNQEEEDKGLKLDNRKKEFELRVMTEEEELKKAILKVNESEIRTNQDLQEEEESEEDEVFEILEEVDISEDMVMDVGDIQEQEGGLPAMGAPAPKEEATPSEHTSDRIQLQKEQELKERINIQSHNKINRNFKSYANNSQLVRYVKVEETLRYKLESFLSNNNDVISNAVVTNNMFHQDFDFLIKPKNKTATKIIELKVVKYPPQMKQLLSRAIEKQTYYEATSGEKSKIVIFIVVENYSIQRRILNTVESLKDEIKDYDKKIKVEVILEGRLISADRNYLEKLL